MRDLIGELKQRALEGGLVDDDGKQTEHAPLPETVIAGVEESLGFRLQPLLRRVYGEIANGGFGPGYGILGLRG